MNYEAFFNKSYKISKQKGITVSLQISKNAQRIFLMQTTIRMEAVGVLWYGALMIILPWVSIKKS